jgi:hypothetical protein
MLSFDRSGYVGVSASRRSAKLASILKELCGLVCGLFQLHNHVDVFFGSRFFSVRYQSRSRERVLRAVSRVKLAHKQVAGKGLALPTGGRHHVRLHTDTRCMRPRISGPLGRRILSNSVSLPYLKKYTCHNTLHREPDTPQSSSFPRSRRDKRVFHQISLYTIAVFPLRFESNDESLERNLFCTEGVRDPW